MRCAVDLHIHSCLSPCGDELMTPNNIAQMAKLKELDMIAVADHNTARQLPAVWAVARAIGLALLPAIELNTREEVHMLAYLPSVEAALNLSGEIYPHLPDIKNRPELFGRQAELDEDDGFVREEERLLISALDLSLDELVPRVESHGGICVPAHINRGATGILQALGFIPPGLRFPAIEVCESLPLPARGLPHVPRLHSSDAHELGAILERTEFLDLPECSARGFLMALGGA